MIRLKHILVILFFWYLGAALLYSGLSWTHVEIFPCQQFVHDSEQGYMSSLCPISDEDDDTQVLLVQQNTADTRPTAGTWVAVVLLFGALPFGVSMLVHRYVKKYIR